MTTAPAAPAMVRKEGVFSLPNEPVVLDPLSVSQQRNFRLAGDTALLEALATRYGITDDLKRAFSGDANQVENLLTLAIHGLLTGNSPDRIPAWQASCKAPQTAPLTSSALRRTLQKISPQQKNAYMKSQLSRFPGPYLYAAYQESAFVPSEVSLPWEKAPERENLLGLLYAKKNLFPAGYVSVSPEGGEEALLTELRKNYEDLDGFLLLSNQSEGAATALGEYKKIGQPFILRAEPSLLPVMEILKALSYADGIPTGMGYDAGSGLAYGKYALPPFAASLSEESIEISDAYVCLFYQLEDRHRRLSELQNSIIMEEKLIGDLASQKISVETVEELKEDLRYHKVTLKGETVRFTRREKKIAKERAAAGYLALITRENDLSCLEALRLYKLLSAQEASLRSFPSCPAPFPQDRNKTAADYAGAWDFVRFIAYQLHSALYRLWSTTELKEIYESPDYLLDEMRPLRHVKYQNGETFLQEPTPAQKAIATALEISMEAEAESVPPKGPAHRKKGPRR
ncbi:MAG: hypothetical protein IIZ39_05100 [Blautia sp.]|nr:hypothetical protein [Blautia sp.]